MHLHDDINEKCLGISAKFNTCNSVLFNALNDIFKYTYMDVQVRVHFHFQLCCDHNRETAF